VGTPFNGTLRGRVEQLAACGMDMSGDEVMYDPRSGRQMDVSSLTMVSYQRLKHIVADRFTKPRLRDRS
jgi:DNA-directed RNA polymerase beta subunit